MVSDAHRRAVHNEYRKRVTGTRPEYNSREYRRRAKAIASSGAMCSVCHKRKATTANHRKMISKGGKLSDGLNGMCLSCASAQGGRAGKPGTKS